MKHIDLLLFVSHARRLTTGVYTFVRNADKRDGKDINGKLPCKTSHRCEVRTLRARSASNDSLGGMGGSVSWLR